MIEKSIYEDYEIDFSDTYHGDNGYYFVFNEKRELYLENEKLVTDIEKFDINFILFIGKYKNKDCFVVNSNFDEGHSLIDIYTQNQELYLISAKAVLVNDWYISHQFCGRCGVKTEIDEKDMMLKCPECGQVHYPRIAPAIIVAIEKDDKLLMAKHCYNKWDDYALIAGFVEPGESIEEAVRREVNEEVGIKIKNIKYLKSQSWPFPNSLMLAFEAEYESGEINVDGNEIEEARWFKKEDIERYDLDISVSDWLIERFINKTSV